MISAPLIAFGAGEHSEASTRVELMPDERALIEQIKSDLDSAKASLDLDVFHARIARAVFNAVQVQRSVAERYDAEFTNGEIFDGNESLEGVL